MLLSTSVVEAQGMDQLMFANDSSIASMMSGGGLSTSVEDMHSKDISYDDSYEESLSPLAPAQYAAEKHSHPDRRGDGLLMLLALATLIALQLRHKHKNLPHRQLMLSGKSNFNIVPVSRMAQPSLKLDLQS